MQCRICGYEGSAEGFEEDTRNHLGFWCPYCDSFSYTLDEHDQRRQFLLWLEDVKIGTPLTDKRIMKQNVSPLRYPGGKTKLAQRKPCLPHGRISGKNSFERHGTRSVQFVSDHPDRSGADHLQASEHKSRPGDLFCLSEISV